MYFHRKFRCIRWISNNHLTAISIESAAIISDMYKLTEMKLAKRRHKELPWSLQKWLVICICQQFAFWPTTKRKRKPTPTQKTHKGETSGNAMSKHIAKWWMELKNNTTNSYANRKSYVMRWATKGKNTIVDTNENWSHTHTHTHAQKKKTHSVFIITKYCTHTHTHTLDNIVPLNNCPYWSNR